MEHFNSLTRAIILLTTLIFIESSSLCQCLQDSILETNPPESVIYKHITKRVQLELKNGTYGPETKNCLKEAINISKVMDNQTWLIKGYDLLARLYKVEGELNKATETLEKALKVSQSQGKKSNEARIYNSFGLLELEKGRPNKAVKYYLSARDIWTELGNKRGIAIIDHNIGLVYKEQKQYRKAINFLNKASKNPDITKSGHIFANLGFLYNEMGVLDSSLFFFDRIDSIKDQISPTLVQKSFSVASVVALKQNNNPRSRYFYQIAVKNTSNNRAKLDLFTSRGDQMVENDQISKAIILYSDAKVIAQELNDPYITEQILQKIATTYQKLGNYKKAWEYHLQHHQIADTLINQEKQKAIDDLIAKYENQKKELRIQALEKQQQSDRTIKWIALALVIAQVAAVGIYYSRYKIKKESTKLLSNQNQLLQDQNVEIRQREEQLQKKNEEISKKNKLLADHSQMIDEKNAELSRHNGDLEQFAYSVTHDLRVPLSAMRSYIQLSRRSLEQDQQKAKQFLTEADENGKWLENLLKDLLSYTRVARSDLTPELVDLDVVLAQVKSNLVVPIKETQGSLNVDPLPHVLGFPSDYYLLFQNLIQNAIKFRSPDRPPVVHVHSKKNKDSYTIAVTDNGIGIKYAYQKGIFKVFQRVNQTHEGTGIGLAIVKKIVEVNQGKISLSSQEGKGTTFYMNFPIPKPIEKT